MQRQLLPALLVVLIGASTAMAQDWARKMFSVSSHDFGTVARGAKVEYRFEFKNPYKETVHVANVWSSCGCTSPEVTKPSLKTYDTSEIVAKFNTRTFTGNHSATLHVVIDKPFNAEVLLNVWGDIRGDLQVEPEQVEFGTIDQGQAVDRKLTVTHSGSSNWKILDVRSVDTNYEVEVKPGPKSYGQVSYDLLVHLKKDTPPGYLRDQLILLTNDSRVTQIPIEVEGLVKAELSASPQSLAFGLVEPGKAATKSIVLHAKRPFKITAAHCDDDSFTFKVPTAASPVQILPVTFTAPDKSEKIAKKIRIETDLGKSFTVEVVAQAEVVSSHPAATPPATKASSAGSGKATDQPPATGTSAIGNPTIGKTGEPSEPSLGPDREKPSAPKADADGAKGVAPKAGSAPADASSHTTIVKPQTPWLRNPFRTNSGTAAAVDYQMGI